MEGAEYVLETIFEKTQDTDESSDPLCWLLYIIRLTTHDTHRPRVVLFVSYFIMFIVVHFVGYFI